MEKFFNDKKMVTYVLLGIIALTTILLWCMPCVSIGLTNQSFTASDVLDDAFQYEQVSVVASPVFLGTVLSVILALVTLAGKRKVGLIASVAALAIFVILLMVFNSVLGSDELKLLVEGLNISMGTGANTIFIIGLCAQVFIWYKRPKTVK